MSRSSGSCLCHGSGIWTGRSSAAQRAWARRVARCRRRGHGRARARRRAGNARSRAGDTPASKQAFREAAELAESRGLAEHLARAALGYGGRIIWEVSRDDEYLAPLLERALAALGEEESPLRVRLLARFAGGPLRDASFPPERKAALSLEGLEMARRMGDRAAL